MSPMTLASMKGEEPEVAKPEIVRPGQTDQDKPGADDERFHSVTTILKALDKPALLYWAAEQAALQAVKVAGSLPMRIKEEGEPAVVKWLRDSMYRKDPGARSAAELGTAVHDAIEQYALDGKRPQVDDEVLPYLDRFDEWAQKWSPTYEAAEAAIYNKQFGFAGTLDAIAVVDGQRVLLDYKSSRRSVDGQGKPTGPYPEAALQMSAYRHAEFMATWRARRFEKFKQRYYLLSAAEEELGVPLPSIDGGLVLHITPEHCEAYPVRCDAEVFESFCFLIEIFRWQQGLSKEVIGSPLERAE